MKKNIFFLCFYSLVFITMLLNAAYLVINNVFVDIDDIPVGEYRYSVISPDGVSELKVYTVKTDLGNAVRVSQTKNKKTENVFWQTGVTDANVYWFDNNTAVINGIPLNFVNGETYDSRNIRSIFNDGLMGWDS